MTSNRLLLTRLDSKKQAAEEQLATGCSVELCTSRPRTAGANARHDGGRVCGLPQGLDVGSKVWGLPLQVAHKKGDVSTDACYGTARKSTASTSAICTARNRRKGVV